MTNKKDKCKDPFKNKRASLERKFGVFADEAFMKTNPDGEYVLYTDAMEEVVIWRRIVTTLTQEKYAAQEELRELEAVIRGQQ